MKKKLLLGLSMSALLLLASCGQTGNKTSSAPAGDNSSQKQDGSEQAAQGYAIAIDQPESTTLAVGDKLNLTAVVTLDGQAAADETITWSTSDAAIATVSDGSVTGVAVGEVTITAKCDSDETKTASITLTIVEKQVNYKNISEVKEGDKAAVKGVVVATNLRSFIISDNTAAVMVYLNTAPEYEIGDYVAVEGTLVASKYSNGLAQFDNKATITKLTETAPAIDLPEELTEAKLEAIAGLFPGDTEAEYSKQFINLTECKPYKWTSVAGKDESYDTLTMVGSAVKIEPVYMDTNKFPIVSGTKYDVEGYMAGYNYHGYVSVVVTKLTEVVSEEAPTALSLAHGIKGKLLVGTSVTLNLTSDGSKSVTWQSSDENKATVNNGVVELKAVGEVTITAKSTIDETVTATIVLNIVEALAHTGADAENAFTADELIEYVDSSAFDANAVVFVSGKVTSASFSADNSNWDIYLAAENGVVQLFRANDTDNLADYKANPSDLVGATIVASGKASYYAGGNKYELNAGCEVASIAPSEAEEVAVDFETDGTEMTVAQVLAAGDANKTQLVRVSGVAEGMYLSSGQVKGIYIVDDATGNCAVVYGAYSDNSYTLKDGSYIVDNTDATQITETIIGSKITVVGLLGNFAGKGQIVDGHVAVVDGTPNVFSMEVATDIEHGTLQLSKEAADTNYGDEITVTVTPDEGYELEKLIVIGATGEANAIDITESLKFNAKICNTVKATFKEAGILRYTLDFAHAGSDGLGFVAKANVSNTELTATVGGITYGYIGSYFNTSYLMLNASDRSAALYNKTEFENPIKSISLTTTSNSSANEKFYINIGSTLMDSVLTTAPEETTMTKDADNLTKVFEFAETDGATFFNISSPKGSGIKNGQIAELVIELY